MENVIKEPFKYCNSLTEYSRYLTREVRIGDVAMGGNNPIRIQSMTTTDTMDTIATVEQTIRMYEAGSEYVRITAPSKKEAQNLAVIKKELKNRGYDVPLIADIHFTPNAAEIAARIVEKVRVNPGNYADKKKFNIIEYTDAQYEAEIERIAERFSPLVKICKEEGTAMRIGTNHGSLSDRIMSRYGDTPIGMVESALEFVRICESLNYYNLVLSMKASNTRVMIQAYRLLVNKMEEEGMNYPLHLGVTEAGDGLDGRVKSAVGIGALLEDGLGDTIRVSLTEAPEAECPVAIGLADRYKKRSGHIYIPNIEKVVKDPFMYEKRSTQNIAKIGGEQVPVVVADLSAHTIETAAQLLDIGYDYSEELDKWHISDQAVDYVYLGKQNLNFEIPGTLQCIVDYDYWNTLDSKTSYLPLYMVSDLDNTPAFSEQLNFVTLSIQDWSDALLAKLSSIPNLVLVLTSDNTHWMSEVRRVFYYLLEKKIACPVVLKRNYTDVVYDSLILASSTDFGSLLVDGLGDGIWLQSTQALKNVNELAFTILQASRTRISKTEYISCPSCGRTLFDLEETTAMIRSRTDHLKGVKIGIMGCIVNGPGEMADADYGYVGSGVGKITLYKGQEVMKRNIPSEQAVDELIQLIKDDGYWTEKI